jgi:aromatic-L-amino-acid decarboxylase
MENKAWRPRRGSVSATLKRHIEADWEAVSSGKTEQQVNDDGRIYLTQPQHEGRFVIRFQVGQTSTAREDVLTAWTVIQELASRLDI